MPRRVIAVQIVNVSASKPQPGQALVVPSWKHVGFFHMATGSLPLSALFHCDQMLALSHTDEDIFRAISSIGQLYASRMGLESFSKRQVHPRTSLIADKRICEDRMRRPSKGSAMGCLPFAMILAIAELLLDDSADNWRGWIEKVFNYIGPNLHDLTGITALEEDLLRFWQLNNVLGSFARPEKPLGSDFSRSLSSRHDGAASAFSAAYDHLLSVLWRVSDLQKRIFDWTSDVTQGPDHQSSVNDTVRGLGIVSEISGMQQEVLDVVLGTSTAEASVSDSLEPFYRWALLGTSQLMQQHANLQALECTLPILPQDLARDQSIAILNDIERLVTKPTLDIAFFLPLMETVHLSPLGDDSRPRVAILLDRAESCGFGVAKALRDHVECLLVCGTAHDRSQMQGIDHASHHLLSWVNPAVQCNDGVGSSHDALPPLLQNCGCRRC
ncbi:hypothetical protein F5X68DRAFT_44179 [Plectosphaerella plurivora]|uniref:Uncharacterized protein n=1 Tax=Plectosphaerella plurivora TaxID=936078 RepID=A0A9P8V3S2_9PEZI|nr:hypothetical protein F5X68DRAFT_44179 [Plectosphaerella plurivora]